MQFATLRQRLLATLRTRVRNGQLTERGLARSVGLSQPHIHNVLKGVRILSPDVADLILRELDLSILDLLDRTELDAYSHAAIRPGCVQLPVLECKIGPGQPWMPSISGVRSFRIKPSIVPSLVRPVVGRTVADPSMGPRFAGEDFVLLDQSETARRDIESGGLFLVLRQRDSVIRRIRRSADGLGIVAASDNGDPCSADYFHLDQSGLLDIVKARVTFITPDLEWP